MRDALRVMPVCLMLGACSSIGDVLPSGGSLLGTSTPAETASNEVKSADDFDCPEVQVRHGASTLTVNAAPARPAPGEEPGALALRYQGTIGRTARECKLNAGVVSIKVGIEGRIIVGPAGGPGQLEIPIRYAVVKEGPEPKPIVTKLHRVQVNVGADSRVSFTHVAEDLSFPMPVPSGDIDAYVVYIGFDPQAEKPKPARPATRQPRPRV